MYEQISYEVADPIATIKLNRPKQLNAWTDQMAAEVKHAMAAAEQDESVVVIVLTGEGRGFCAGADLKGLQDLSTGKADRGRKSNGLKASPGNAEMHESFRGHYSYLMSLRKPVIAAINGPCAGMAMPISLCCDMRFASDRAIFTTAFAQRGLIAEWGISWTLSRLVGPAHAMDLILSARRVDAMEAERIGLVNKVYPHDELMPAVYAYAREMATRCSPASMAVMKRQIYQDMTESLAHANDDSLRLMRESFDRPDFEEGVRSFLEKRAPAFGRV
ncbi:MAG TPA: enoyl-CoA hydratase [Myxococcales bacterium]|nr:enoyl-CoA hydratase [Myxococcales bacterium]